MKFTRTARPGSGRWLLRGMALACAIYSSPAQAHNGPAYPILMDKPVGAYQVSIWTDPDVGVGTFYVVLAPLPGTAFEPPQRVQISVQPADKRLKVVSYTAGLQEPGDSTKYLAQVPFDKAGKWNVRVQLKSASGSSEVSQQVDVTPDDLGKLGLLLYMFPFVAIGALWMRGMARERRRRDALASGNFAPS